MAYPKLLRRLFENEGAGPKINAYLLPAMDYLPTAGGTMSGHIIIDPDILSSDGANNFDIGFSWKARTGSGIGFRGLGYESNPGGFEIYARNATDSTGLKGTAAGVLTWGEDTVLTATRPLLKIPTSKAMHTILGTTSPVGTQPIITASQPGTTNYGTCIAFGGNGNTVIGAGESPHTCLSTDLVTSEGENMYVTSDNNVYFYSNCNTYSSKKTATFTTGGVFQAPSFKATSDIRQKENLEKKHYDLSSLSAYRYTFKVDGQKHVGLVAQEVQKVVPEAVEEIEGKLTLDYNAVVAALVAEVNELKKRISELEAK